MENITNLNIDLLLPNPSQPRKIFNEETILELSNSIKEYGILNPLLVIKKGEKYEIIAGERRYRAAKLAGITEVPVIIKNVPEETAKEIALIENLQRENLNPVEEAKTYEEIINTLNITEKELGLKIGKSQSAIANKIRLLNLPEEVTKALAEKKISERHARNLLRVNDNQEKIKVLNEIIEKKLTVKELENLIKKEQEKESDKMNNGNFFPNYNNPTGDQTGATLNMMNAQSMAGTQNISQETVMPTPPINPVDVTPQAVMPTPEIIPPVDVAAPITEVTPPEVTITPTIETPEIGAPSIDIPLFNQNIEMPQAPIAEVPQPEVTNIPVETPEIPVVNPFENIPTVGVPKVEENMTPLPVVEPVSVPPVAENPVISSPEVSQELIQPTDILAPVEMPTEPIAVSEPVVSVEPAPEPNKVALVEDLLTQNGISYKSYSNDTGHCIIIEL